MNTLQAVQGATVTTGFRKELFMEWIAFIDAKPKTVETYTRAIKQFLGWLVDRGITNPSREDIISYRDELKVDHKPTTVQSYLVAVKQFFHWTQQRGIYPDIADRVKGARIERGYKKDYLTSRQCAKLLATIDRGTLKGKRDYALLALMLTTGIRTIEACRADIKDIATAGDNTVLYLLGKGRDEKSEYVKLEPHAEEALREYLAERKETTPESPLFASIANRNNEQRMTTRSISRIAKERLKGANLISERLTAHSLRHTSATLALLNGSKPEEVQQLLRHSKLDTTMIYSHALERAKNDSEMRIGKAIFGK